MMPVLSFYFDTEPAFWFIGDFLGESSLSAAVAPGGAVYQSPVTSHQSPVTSHQSLVTSH